MRDSIAGRRVGGAVLVAVGAVLLANPLWLGSLTVYPGTGWGFLPLFHAGFSTVGLIAVVVGSVSVRTPRYVPSNRHLGVFAAGTIVAVPSFAVVLASVIGTGGPGLDGYGFRQALVAGFILATFTIGCAISLRQRSTVGLALAVPVVPFGLVAVEWPSGALLGPVLNFYFLLTGDPIGIPYPGPMLFVAAFALGLWVGWPESGATQHTGSASSDRTP